MPHRRRLQNPAWDDYTPAAHTACLQVLGTVVKAIGGQHESRVVLVGGLVPQLLLDEHTRDLTLDMAPHPGTNDVDLCLELNVAADSDDFYQCIEQVLQEHAFARATIEATANPSVWRWVRAVNGITVALEFLTSADGVVAAGGQNTFGRLATGEPTRVGDAIGALRIPGAHLALRDPVQRTIEIELLDGRGLANVTVRVANILAFLALKSRAVKHREKDKDPFDLVWVLTHSGTGGHRVPRVRPANVPARITRMSPRRFARWPTSSRRTATTAAVAMHYSRWGRPSPRPATPSMHAVVKRTAPRRNSPGSGRAWIRN
jgi:hypothetical protein